MKILEIYKKYKIMPQLAEHQLKVAGVAGMICDNWKRGMARKLTRNGAETYIDRENIVAACLLHDMGNIIKFDFNFTHKLNPERFSKEDLIYWQKIKEGFMEEYGKDEHIASMEICKDIGVNNRVLELVDSVGFLTAILNAKGDDFGKKTIQYADDRVAPWGVASLEERFADLAKRYSHHKTMTRERNNFENALLEIEKQIFANCTIKPEEITEGTVNLEIEKLRNFDPVRKIF